MRAFLALLGVAVAAAAVLAFGFARVGRLPRGELHALSFPLAQGSPQGARLDMGTLQGRAVLVTNVASACGYTESNYEQLAQLQRKFGEDLAVVLVPSNEFGAQEPGSEGEIVRFVRARGGERFYVLAKSAVNGEDQHPLIALLKKATQTEDKDITWNFETKFIIGPTGEKVSRYSDAFRPLELVDGIRFLLKAFREDL